MNVNPSTNERSSSGGTELPTGITIRRNKKGDSLWVYFPYKGEDCRENLNSKPTPKNIKLAGLLRGKILTDIREGTFCYGKVFPNSKRGRKLGRNPKNATIGQLLAEELKIWERTLEKSTVRGYRIAIDAHLVPQFGAVRVQDLSVATLRSWISGLSVTAKRVRNILTPLKAVLDTAVIDELIEDSPLDKIKLKKLLNKKTRKSTFVVDPFNTEEVKAILAAAPEPQHRNLLQFAFATGLRTSELIALQWSDIDWSRSTVHVSRAFVEGEMKPPKTEAGIRDVDLTSAALEALERQKEFTRLQGDRIFHNPRTKKPWKSDAQIRRTCWIHAVKKAGIRYRNPYQTRHTFASTHLCNGKNPWWLAKQMGHETVEMINRHYGRWIPEHRQSHESQAVSVPEASTGTGT